MELVDITGDLPNLKCSRGLSTWRVMTKTGEFVDNPEELPDILKTQFKMSVFPPSPQEAERFNLDRCIRILPHQQDTGGFFVAVLRKLAHIPGEKEDDTVWGTPVNQAAGDKRPAGNAEDQPKAKKQKIYGYKEDPFFFMDEANPIWPQVKEFFGLADCFSSSQLLYRSEQEQSTLYYVAPVIRDITQRNDGRIRFINMGVKAFSRSPSPLVPSCDFRITMESMGTIVPFVKKRIVTVTSKDAIIITSEENPYTDKLSAGLQEQLKELSAGSSIFVFKPSAEDPTPACEIVFCGWRGKTSVRCFGSRFDRAHILSLLGEDLKEINKKVEEKKKEKARLKALEEEAEIAKDTTAEGDGEVKEEEVKEKMEEGEENKEVKKDGEEDVPVKE